MQLSNQTKQEAEVTLTTGKTESLVTRRCVPCSHPGLTVGMSSMPSPAVLYTRGTQPNHQHTDGTPPRVDMAAESCQSPARDRDSDTLCKSYGEA